MNLVSYWIIDLYFRRACDSKEVWFDGHNIYVVNRAEFFYSHRELNEGKVRFSNMANVVNTPNSYIQLPPIKSIGSYFLPDFR